MGGLAPLSAGQDQLSYQTIFFLHLPAEAVQFGFLNWANAEAAFGWPATVGAKLGGIRELQTTIQAIFSHRCSPQLSLLLRLTRHEARVPLFRESPQDFIPGPVECPSSR